MYAVVTQWAYGFNVTRGNISIKKKNILLYKMTAFKYNIRS